MFLRNFITNKTLKNKAQKMQVKVIYYNRDEKTGRLQKNEICK